MVAFLPLGGSEIELVKPTTDDFGLGRYLEKRGPGMHHICLEVDDIEGMLAQLKEKGIQLINETPLSRLGREAVCLYPPEERQRRDGGAVRAAEDDRLRTACNTKGSFAAAWLAGFGSGSGLLGAELGFGRGAHPWGFFPMWLGYCLAVDGLVLMRTGTSLLKRSWQKYIGSFADLRASLVAVRADQLARAELALSGREHVQPNWSIPSGLRSASRP